MVTPTVAERFRDGGVPLIDPAAGARAFVANSTARPNRVLAILIAARGRQRPAAPAGGEVVVDAPSGTRTSPTTGSTVSPWCRSPPSLDWFAGAAAAWRPERPRRPSCATCACWTRSPCRASPTAVTGSSLRGHEATAEDGPALDLDLRDDAGRPHYRASWSDRGGAAALRRAGRPRPSLEPMRRPVREHDAVPRPGAAGHARSPRPSARWRRRRSSPRRPRWAGPAGVGDVDVAAVDGALQLALLWARRAGAGDTLPMGVGEVRLRRRGPVDGEARCIVRAVRVDDAGAVCDVGLVDADGVPRVELHRRPPRAPPG